eukprot:GEMP01018238.1.p1 GENE.GEMP01018238.1~~GEMP01018238.1.p1  ORF type:complete len:665 (-),score=144.21 GEMP01018238.1:575-2569(-)
MSGVARRSVPSLRRIYQMDARECRKEMQKAAWDRMRIKEVWDAFLYRACVIRGDFTARDLSLVLDVVGKQTDVEKQRFTEFLLDEVQRKAHNFSVRDATLMFNALAKMRIVDAPLIDLFLPFLVKKLPRQTVMPKDAALLAFSLARLEVPVDDILPVIDQVVATLTPRIENIKDGHTLSLLFFAFSKVGNQSFLSLLEKQVARVLPRCSTIDLIYLIRGYSHDTNDALVTKTQKELLNNKLFDVKPAHFIHLIAAPCTNPLMKEKIFAEMRYRVRDFRPATCVELMRKVDAPTQQLFLRYLSKRRKPQPPLQPHQILTLSTFVDENVSDDGKETLLLQLPHLKTCEDPDLILSIMEIYARLKIRDTHWHHILSPQRFRKDQLGQVAMCLAKLSFPTIFDEQQLLSRAPRTPEFLQAAAIFGLTKLPQTLKLDLLMSEESKPPLLRFALDEETSAAIEAPKRHAELRQRIFEHLSRWGGVTVHTDVAVPHAYTVPFALELTEVAQYLQREPLTDYVIDVEEEEDTPQVAGDPEEKEHADEEAQGGDEEMADDDDVVEEEGLECHDRSPLADAASGEAIRGIDRRTHALVDILSADDFYHKSDRIVSLTQRSKGHLLNMERLAYLNVLKRLKWPVITISESSWNTASTPEAHERNRRYILTLISHL